MRAGDRRPPLRKLQLRSLLAGASEFVSSSDAGFEQFRRNVFRAAEHFGEDRHLRGFFDDQVGARRGGGIRAEGEYAVILDRKSTRLNSSHVEISYAVFCLKKKMIDIRLFDVTLAAVFV